MKVLFETNVILDVLLERMPFSEHESARHAGAEFIITRNIKDFKRSKIPVYTPIEFLSMLESLD